MMTRVKILDEIVYMSFQNNAVEKGMNQSSLLTFMGKFKLTVFLDLIR